MNYLSLPTEWVYLFLLPQGPVATDRKVDGESEFVLWSTLSSGLPAPFRDGDHNHEPALLAEWLLDIRHVYQQCGAFKMTISA